MQRHSINRPKFNRLKSAIDLGLRTMRHPGAWAAATLAVGSGASAAPALEPVAAPHSAALDRSASATRSLVLVDPGVDRAGVLLGDLPPNAAIIALPAAGDPITEIGRAVRMHRDIGEIHVLSHGRPGVLELAGRRIDANALEARTAELQRWFADRDAAPAIVLYGCSSGAGDDGLDLINTLARLTGATVSASDDATGRPADGGDWIFERSTGIAARAPIFGAAARAEFEGLLATFTVGNTNDSGADSLRQAILDANASPGPDVVDATGITGTITLTSGRITITDEVEINGPGASDLTISGYYGDNIFQVDADTTISGVTLANGNAADGGAILNDSGSTLSISDTTISNSYAYNYGGAISQTNGELVIRNSTITGNRAFFSGGGISFTSYYDAQSRVYISNSTISDNETYYNGGGIDLRVGYYAGGFRIADSTITGNATPGEGGGIRLSAARVYRDATYAGDLTISNSTVSNNYAGTGGGVFVSGRRDVGDVEITDSAIEDNFVESTYSDNILRGDGGRGNGIGGGVLFDNDQGYGGLTITGTTVTGNTADGGGGVAAIFDSYGSTVSIEDSIITDNSAEGGGGPIPIRGGGAYGARGFGGGVLLFNEERITTDPDYSPRYGSLTIRGSTISGNSAAFGGGGIAGLTRQFRRFRGSDDTETAAEAETSQRGKYFPGPTYLSEITIADTTVSGNDAQGGGGLAIIAEGARGVTLTNSTVSGNSADFGAGGIAVYGVYYEPPILNADESERGVSVPPGITIDLDLVTVAGNTLTGAPARGVGPGAGGIGILGQNDSAAIRNTIIADNTGTPYNDLFGPVYADFTLVEDPNGATITGNDNITGSDPLLGPLADNGGTTLTHLPAVGSPALDAGDPAFSPPPAADQRGLARVSQGTVDMGSVEVQAPNIAFAPTPLDFGTQKVGTTSASAGVTISNTGGPLEITSIAAAAAPFADVGGTCAAPPFVLEDGDSCTLTYTFSPTATGPVSQAIAVASNDSDGPFEFTVAGEGIQGTVELVPSPIDLGGVTVGDTSAPLDATLSNVGDADVVVSGLSAPSAPFALTGGSCGTTPFTLSPSSSCTLTFTFSPAAPGVANDQLAVTSDASNSPFEVTVTGEGIAGQPDIGISRNDVDFGTVELGVGQTGIVTLTNTGTGTLNISQITDPGAPFALGFGTRGLNLCSTPPFDLAPAASCDIEVSFDPVSAGTFVATFDVVSNAPTSPDAVTLRGNVGSVVPVPVLGPWGLALLSGLMGLLGWLGLRRRPRART